MFLISPKFEEGQARFTTVPIMMLVFLVNNSPFLSVVSLSKRLENGVRYVPKGISLRATSQVSIFQVTTS